MRCLIRPRPQIHITIAEVIALEFERAGRGPGLDDQIVRFVKALVRKGRIDAGRMIFGADAAHEAGDQAALRQNVEHREFFGDVDRIADNRQRAAEHGDLGGLGALDERARDQVRRRHHAVSGLMVFVDADDVEAEFFGIGQLIEIGIVFRGAFFRIVEAVGQHHPGRAMFGRRFQVERPIRHQMKAGEFHADFYP